MLALQRRNIGAILQDACIFNVSFCQVFSSFNMACGSSLESLWINAYHILIGVIENLLALSVIAWLVLQLFPAQ